MTKINYLKKLIYKKMVKKLSKIDKLFKSVKNMVNNCQKINKKLKWKKNVK
jgi:hypothetical protein